MSGNLTWEDEVEYTGRTGEEELGKLKRPPKGQVWTCRQCQYTLNAGTNCVNCGRDWFGAPGSVTSVSDDGKPFRPQVRGGAEPFD